MQRVGALARLTGTLLLATTAGACGDESEHATATSLSVTPLPTPAAAGAAQASLAPLADGRAVLTWHEPDSGGHALRLAVLEDTSWSEVMTVARGRDFIVNWADFPAAVGLAGDRLAVHWLEREGTDTYAYGVRIAFSDDGGRTWSAPLRPHSDSTETEHGFVSMLPTDDGGVEAFWLDGRKFATDRPEMTLRTTRVGPRAAQPETLLDPRICDCCQTDAALAGDGPVVVYRDRSPAEIRDIALVRRVGGEWTAPVVVHEDGWELHGCPVNGPAVAADDGIVVVAWYTSARDTSKVQVAFSRDGGATFGDPVRVDDGDPVGRVDVVLGEDGRALVSWIERQGGGEANGALRVRAIDADGTMGPAGTVASISSARASGFPRMAPSGSGVIIAWHDVDGEQVRIARLSAD